MKARSQQSFTGPLAYLFAAAARRSRPDVQAVAAEVAAVSATMRTFFAIAITVWLRDAQITPDTPLPEAMTSFIEANPLMPIMLIVFQWVELALVIKRLQDRVSALGLDTHVRDALAELRNTFLLEYNIVSFERTQHHGVDGAV